MARGDHACFAACSLYLFYVVCTVFLCLLYLVAYEYIPWCICSVDKATGPEDTYVDMTSSSAVCCSSQPIYPGGGLLKPVTVSVTSPRNSVIEPRIPETIPESSEQRSVRPNSFHSTTSSAPYSPNSAHYRPNPQPASFTYSTSSRSHPTSLHSPLSPNAPMPSPSNKSSLTNQATSPGAFSASSPSSSNAALSPDSRLQQELSVLQDYDPEQTSMLRKLSRVSFRLLQYDTVTLFCVGILWHSVPKGIG